MLQEICQLERYFHQQAGTVAITMKSHLRVPVRDMLIALPLSLLTQRGNNVPKGTQTLVDILSFFQPILVIPSPAFLESFGTSEVDKIERPLAGIPSRRILC